MRQAAEVQNEHSAVMLQIFSEVSARHTCNTYKKPWLCTSAALMLCHQLEEIQPACFFNILCAWSPFKLLSFDQVFIISSADFSGP